MSPIVRNILAVLAGIFIGGAVNMGIITIGGYLIPPPEGIDVTTVEGLKEGQHLMETKHFIMPFLAHAFGTLVGALIAGVIAADNKMRYAMIIGIIFLAGGVSAVFMIPAPTWFIATDLILAYIPMAYLGGKIVRKR